jgi:hypothetical protein
MVPQNLPKELAQLDHGLFKRYIVPEHRRRSVRTSALRRQKRRRNVERPDGSAMAEKSGQRIRSCWSAGPSVPQNKFAKLKHCNNGSPHCCSMTNNINCLVLGIQSPLWGVTFATELRRNLRLKSVSGQHLVDLNVRSEMDCYTVLFLHNFGLSRRTLRQCQT